ncbi:MAG: formylglycine-generating enzyme family protein, partial [Deltaproteobacteria bacterium]|nr:formylglycine-generating enzyme family protein [Deltaproteobacteria bacterium]
MGSPRKEPGRLGGEIMHKVNISKGFYIQTTEVTQGQWASVMGNNPSKFKKCGADCPIERVSWKEVQQFIRKLNEKEKQNLYRLPTEAEWEYACRAGSTTAFFNGDISETVCRRDPNLDIVGWYCGNSGNKTHPVALKRPNAWGLYDMHGNVSEWCQDWYGGYPQGYVTDPAGPSNGIGRVHRGGSWRRSAMGCRSAQRFKDGPAWKYHFLGFRLVR